MATEAQSATQAKRILVVKDEAMIRMLLEDMLGELGYTVAAEAARIDEALEATKNAEFDLAILDANLKDQQNGGHGNFTGWTCLPYGMPMMMYAFWPIEFVVTPQTTYVLIDHQDAIRRIYTDGRAMPPNAEPMVATPLN